MAITRVIPVSLSTNVTASLAADLYISSVTYPSGNGVGNLTALNAYTAGQQV